MIIDLALEKGMKETPLMEDPDKSDTDDSIEDKFKTWDQNEDEFIDKTEVSIYHSISQALFTRTRFQIDTVS